MPKSMCLLTASAEIALALLLLVPSSGLSCLLLLYGAGNIWQILRV